ncbi:predicted protein [Micromonas commoda]|uniref:Uncharacterized protein n=1 Tax=Micromonas commoda (strain RCC299 / NOUM17 / CCMP2709) TaxID=296587 RepID=C1EF80_MICCC|nr:predicted protein [Micromonas commoda]ACO67045.1 predicted protein [Micromonas commoda]|eukprot:XP_002505787.1 predicted protein [Micromonas commoda]
MTTSSLLRPEVGASGLFSRGIPGPSSAPRRGPVAVARLGTLGTRGCRGVSLRAVPLVRGRVAVGFTAPRAIASDKIPKRADDASTPSELEEKISSPDPGDAPKPPSAVIDVQSMTSTASNDDPEAASDGGGGSGGEGDGGSGGGGGGGDEGSGDDARGRRPGQPELPESMVALATWAVSQTKDWSAAADGGLRAAFGTLVGVNCITVMLVRAMRGRSERRRRQRDEAKKAALEAKNVAAHEEELAALSARRAAEKNAAKEDLAFEKEVGGAGTPNTSPAFPPARRDPTEVLNSMSRRPDDAAAAAAAAGAAPGTVPPASSSFGTIDGFDTDEAEDFFVRALESYDGVDALEGLPDVEAAAAAENGVQSRTSLPSPSPSPSSPPLAGEDVLAFAVIPDDARDPRVVAALGDVARAQAAAADAMLSASAATARAADATAAAQRLQRAIAAGASEEELNAIAAQAASAANGAVAVAGKVASTVGAKVPAGANVVGVGRAAKVAAGGIAAAAGAVARGVSIATPVVVDGARRYVPAAADAVGRGAKTVWDGDETPEGKRRPGLKTRASQFFAKFKRKTGADGGEDGGETAAPAV